MQHSKVNRDCTVNNIIITQHSVYIEDIHFLWCICYQNSNKRIQSQQHSYTLLHLIKKYGGKPYPIQKRCLSGFGKVCMRSTWRGLISWNVMPCSPLKVNQHFRGICHLHQVQGISQTRNQRERGSRQSLPHAGFMLHLFFDWS
jgi:hypothetical protein